MASLIEFYDDFVDFQARCAFYCDAISALAAHQEWDLTSRHGLSLHSNQLKGELEQLRYSLRQLIDKCPNPDGAD